MTSNRISKKAAQSDPIVAALAHSGLWMRDNAQKVLIGIGVVVALAALSVFLVVQQKQNEALASEKLLTAQYYAGSGDINRAMAALVELEKNFGSTASGRRATLEKADLLYNSGKVQEARKAYEAVRGRVVENSFEGLSVLNGLAACEDQQGHPELAAPLYEKIAGLKLAGEGRQLALWSAARCWRDARQPAKAIVALEGILKDYPYGRYADMTKQALAELRAGLTK